MRIGSRDTYNKRAKGHKSVTASDAIFKNLRCVTNGLLVPNDASSERCVFWVHETKAHVADAHAERPRAPGAVESFGWRPIPYATRVRALLFLRVHTVALTESKYRDIHATIRM